MMVIDLFLNWPCWSFQCSLKLSNKRTTERGTTATVRKKKWFVLKMINYRRNDTSRSVIKRHNGSSSIWMPFSSFVRDGVTRTVHCTSRLRYSLFYLYSLATSTSSRVERDSTVVPSFLCTVQVQVARHFKILLRLITPLWGESPKPEPEHYLAPCTRVPILVRRTSNITIIIRCLYFYGYYTQMYPVSSRFPLFWSRRA